jgi:rhodanese-related sulfurtransferase
LPLRHIGERKEDRGEEVGILRHSVGARRQQMKTSKRSLNIVVALVALGSVGLAACADNDVSSNTVTADAAQSPAVGQVTIIDVRTPAEFAEGHLEGAVNHNVEDGTLASVLTGLDPAAEYVVYCRSGNRSAVAAELMAGAGFANVSNLGSVAEASAATGLPVVTG